MDTGKSEPIVDDVETAPISSPVSAADVGSASRSCLVILLLGAVIVLLVCVSLAVRMTF